VARKAGSVVVEQLRDRILVGRYFGRWAPGDRLPSVRDVARLEAVDRKTAAAAYRRLQQEGLVRVEPRSGVYLRPDVADGSGDPLRRLHTQWLEHALTTAADLGLSVASVARMLHGVGVVEAQRIPVVDEDPQHAALLADELTERTSLRFIPAGPQDLPAATGPLHDVPFAVATPSTAVRMRAVRGRIPVVAATLAPDLLDRVGRAASQANVVAVVGTTGLLEELQRAVNHGLVNGAHRVRIVLPDRSPANGSLEALRSAVEDARAVIWPGAPRWVVGALGDAIADDLNGDPLLSLATLQRIRAQIARTALEQVSRSSVA
jgi:DNA-binding transcriptional regulator YhcF (GntR family)